MKQKVPGRWIKRGNQWKLEEKYVERGPSRAESPKRDYVHSSEQYGKGTGKVSRLPPKHKSFTYPQRSEIHPADRGAEAEKGWKRAVGIRRARERKKSQ